MQELQAVLFVILCNITSDQGAREKEQGYGSFLYQSQAHAQLATAQEHLPREW